MQWAEMQWENHNTAHLDIQIYMHLEQKQNFLIPASG